MSNSFYPLVRAARGPLVLIALGALFALDQGGVISFSRTWPILFILFGVLKLIERLLAPPPPPVPQYYPPAPPPPPGSATIPPRGGYSS